MQLSGPSIVVDTASSSSNVALYQGARALMNGDCNAALVGGVDIISSPDVRFVFTCLHNPSNDWADTRCSWVWTEHNF